MFMSLFSIILSRSCSSYQIHQQNAVNLIGSIFYFHFAEISWNFAKYSSCQIPSSYLLLHCFSFVEYRQNFNHSMCIFNCRAQCKQIEIFDQAILFIFHSRGKITVLEFHFSSQCKSMKV